MPLNSQIYNIRIQVCEKCYEHYNHNNLIHSKSYHKAYKSSINTKNNQQNKQDKHPDFIEQEQQYSEYFNKLIQYLDSLQNHCLQKQKQQQQHLNYHLIKNINKQSTSNNQSPFILNSSPIQQKSHIKLQSSPIKLTSSSHNHKISNTKSQQIPLFRILRNKPYKYLSKLPDTKISSKRYLNNCTNKIIQFPKRDSFEIYFENLLIFSRLQSNKWPNIKLICRIIKCLVQYCRQQGPLMHNMRQFINEYMDIKSVDEKINIKKQRKQGIYINLALYEYLIMNSPYNMQQQLTQQQQDRLIQYLQLMIEGRVKIINIKNRQSQYVNNYIKRDILPYSIIDNKIKTNTISNIYLGKQNIFKEIKYKQKNKHQLFNNLNRLNNSNNQYNSQIIKLNTQFHQQQSKFYNKQNNLVTTTYRTNKKKSRPLSSNLGYIKKSSSAIGFNIKNQVFSMIKMGDYQQNLYNQSNNNHIIKSSYHNLNNNKSSTNNNKFINNNYKSLNHNNKSLNNKQLNQLCSLNNQNNKLIKTINNQNKITQQTKLYLNNKFHIVQNHQLDNKNNEQQDHSIIYTKFGKFPSSNNLKRNSLHNENENLFNQLQQNDDGIDGNYGSKKCLKIVPSKKIKRASLFLNQRQSNLLEEQLKKLNSKNQQNSSSFNKKKQSKQANQHILLKRLSSNSQRSKTFKQNSSQSQNSSSPISSHASIQQMDQQVRLSSKVKVLKNSINKRKSSRRQSQISGSTNKLDDLDIDIKPNLHHNNNHSLLIQSPNKLSVRSRRKSSFYYSTAKNNSLLQMIKGNQQQNAKKQQKKKLKKMPSQRNSRIVLQRKQQVQQGIQCNFDQQIQKQNIQSQPDINQQLNEDKKSQLNSKTSLHPSNHIIDDKKLLQQPKQNIISKDGTRSSRVSGFSRISKFSFQNHLSFKQPLDKSKQKDQIDQMVAVFPQNKFIHAFIVQKFIQKQFYQIDIKKMFTTKQHQKSQVFQFRINCNQVYRQYKIESINKMFQTCSDKKIVLFPKIFQQVQNYSTPLVQVVNRLLKFHPISISRLFTNAHGISPLGQYCVWIYHKGINQFKPIFINDLIPFYQFDENQLNFFSPKKLKNPVYGPITNQNSIWFILLQKALAKVLGSYYDLQQAHISDIFSMLTGCPVVNIEHISVQKLQKIFSEKIFSNKKAYVYSLKKESGNNMRIDRIVGMQINEKNHNLSVARIQQKQTTQTRLDLQSLIRKYNEMCLIFFNLTYVFNQVLFPILKRDEQRYSNLISFYIINEEADDKTDLYLILGGFGKPYIQSKITIYQQTQQQQNDDLKQLQLTDPLSYYNHKYMYQGEIEKKGNYFFQTQLKYGKFLCLIQANFQPQHQYYISTYSSKQVTIHQLQHNYTENQSKYVVDPLEKIISANRLRRKLKKQNKLCTIKQDQPVIHQYPIKIVAQRRDSCSDDLVPYDFSTYKKINKVSKFKPSDSVEQYKMYPSKWVIEKQFVQDQDYIQEKKQRHIQNIINQIQKFQQKNQNVKLKKQLRTNQKDAVLKMMSRIDEKSRWIQNADAQGIVKTKRTRKNITKQINWAAKQFAEVKNGH